ncbi:MAG TPA: glycosyltransferase family 9 protein [Planctomycetota bacterium]|nr:glycosyltransferase family 9 protein [Planctomycetota bacterium]
MVKQGDPRALAIHMGALGDFVLALPALAEIARTHELEAWGPSVERLSIALAPRGPLARVRRLPDSLFGDEPVKLDFDRVFVFARREGPLAKNLPDAVFLPIDGPGHVSDVLLAALAPSPREAGRGLGWGVPFLEAPPHPTSPPLRGGEEMLLIHPGAGGKGKRWPAARFAEVARRSPLEVACVLGPAELDPPDPELRIASRVIEAPTLDDLVRLLARARVYLGNDAGVTHLAAALGVRTVALFGPTDPARWGPRGRSVTIVRAPAGDLSKLDVETVLAAVFISGTSI